MQRVVFEPTVVLLSALQREKELQRRLDAQLQARKQRASASAPESPRSAPFSLRSTPVPREAVITEPVPKPQRAAPVNPVVHDSKPVSQAASRRQSLARSSASASQQPAADPAVLPQYALAPDGSLVPITYINGQPMLVQPLSTLAPSQPTPPTLDSQQSRFPSARAPMTSDPPHRTDTSDNTAHQPVSARAVEVVSPAAGDSLADAIPADVASLPLVSRSRYSTDIDAELRDAVITRNPITSHGVDAPVQDNAPVNGVDDASRPSSRLSAKRSPHSLRKSPTPIMVRMMACVYVCWRVLMGCFWGHFAGIEA